MTGVHGGTRRDLADRRAVTQPGGEGARCVDLQEPALLGGLRPVAEDRLAALARQGRPDHAGDGEALEPVELRVVGHQRIGADVDVLASTGVGAIDSARDMAPT